MAGRIGLRTVDPGNIVAANATTGIAVITQMKPIDVQFAVPQDRVPDIQAQLAKGEALQVRALDRMRSAVLDTGVFSTLDNMVDTSTGTVRAKARFANNGTPLFPNQFVNVQMVLRTVDALVVPVTAVRIGPDGNFVYVVNEDRTVALRNVKRGEATVDVVAILDGLKAGEDVVTEGGDRLKDGARVALQGDKPATRRRGAGAVRSRRGPRRRAGSADGGAGRRGQRAERPRRRLRRTCDESFASLHRAAGRDRAADARDRARGPGRFPVPAAGGAAAGRLPDHPGADAVPGRQPGSDEPHRDRAAGAPVRPDGRAGRA